MLLDRILAHHSDDVNKGGKIVIYSKPQVEIVKFDTVGFMTYSGGATTPEQFVTSYGVTSWNGNNTFSCSGFGGCNGKVYTPGGGYFSVNGGGRWKYHEK